MAKYLIDANLPYYFSLWNNPDYIHVNDLNDAWSDEKIWDYAKEHNLVIITKDADFSIKVLYLGAPPKVIHLRFGNLKIADFHKAISKNWETIKKHIQAYTLINVYLDRIELIN